MATKAEQTTEYIIKMVAPVFNKNGYTGTSMADITAATGLTKGAIYGNFKNKEELAVKAYNYNLRKVIYKIDEHLRGITSSVEKLKALSDFYRNYYELVKLVGGCPIVNIGVDANHQNVLLFERVKEVIRKLERKIAEFILEGIKNNEIRNDADPEVYARRIFALIEGGVFMSTTMEDNSYLKEMMDHLDNIIDVELSLKTNTN